MTTEQIKIISTGALRILQLDRPASLNALGLDLMTELRAALVDAYADDSVKTIWLESTSPRAFCAGGDVKALALRLDELSLNIEKTALAREYFELEYGIDLLIDQSPKPIVAFAQGITFGGGWGLFAGANLRLCNSEARFAMPENQIGFYPDVGAAYFLQHPNWKIGTVLGLGGFPISAKEAMALDYVDDIISEDYAEVLKKQLASGIDVTELDIDASTLDTSAVLNQWQTAMELLPDEAALTDWINIIEANAGEFEFYQRAKQNWSTGSAWSLALTWEYFRRMRDADRAAVLTMDVHVGSNVCTAPDFIEGVHAKLVHKKGTAEWLYPHVESVPLDDITKVFDA